MPPREKLKGKHIWQTKTPFYPTLPPPFFCRPFWGMEGEGGGEGELLSAAVHLKTFSSTSILLSFFVTKSSPPPPPPPFPFSRWIRRGFLPDERRASASLLLLKSPPLIKIVSGKKGALSNFLPISFLQGLFLCQIDLHPFQFCADDERQKTGPPVTQRSSDMHKCGI